MRTIAASRLIPILLTLASIVATAQPSLASEPLVAGKVAPEFELPDQFGQLHSLEDYRGQWVVLYFYPKDGTPGCTTEACEFRDNIFEFKKLHSQVIGVSLDDVESHEGFSERHGLPFPLLADPTGIVVDAYGLKTRMFGMAVAKRQTFLIDPEGHIAKHYESVNPSTHSVEILADLAELGAGSTD